MLNPVSDDGEIIMELRCPECNTIMDQDDDGFFCAFCQPSADEMFKTEQQAMDYLDARDARNLNPNNWRR